MFRLLVGHEVLFAGLPCGPVRRLDPRVAATKFRLYNAAHTELLQKAVVTKETQ
jgi:hypothetical protein